MSPRRSHFQTGESPGQQIDIQILISAGSGPGPLCEAHCPPNTQVSAREDGLRKIARQRSLVDPWTAGNLNSNKESEPLLGRFQDDPRLPDNEKTKASSDPEPLMTQEVFLDEMLLCMY